MKIIKNLYVGEKAKSDKKRIIKGLSSKKIQPGIYIITLPTGNGLLDIYPAFTLKYPIFKDRRIEELYIVGIANGREDAFGVVSEIVEDSLGQTGGFDIPSFIGVTQKKWKNL